MPIMRGTPSTICNLFVIFLSYLLPLLPTMLANALSSTSAWLHLCPCACVLMHVDVQCTHL